MATVEEVIIRLNDQFSTAAKKVEGSVKSLSSGFSALAGAAALGGVTIAVKKAVEAFAEQEKVSAQLNFALRSVGVTAKSVTTDYLNFAKEMSRASMFQDEQITQTETLLTQYGLYGDELKRTTKAAIDFATATGTDLHSATMLFAKASEGSTAALSRYGIKVSDAELTTKGFAAVLDASEAKFRGFGQAALDTTAGAMNQFTKGIEDAQKAVGGLFASIDKKYGITKALTKTFQELADGVETLQDPTTQIHVKMRDLNDELERQQKIFDEKSGAGGDGFIFAESSKNKIIALKNELAALQAQLVSVNNAATGGSQKSADTVKRPRYSDDEKAAFDKFINGIVEKNAEGFDKIDAARKKSFAELDKLAIKGLKNTKEYAEARKNIETKALQDTIELTAKKSSQGFDAITQLAKGNIGGFVSGIASMLPPHIGAIVGAAQSAVTAITTVFSLFASHTRSETQKFLDDIGKINKAVADAVSNISLITSEEEKRKAGLIGQKGQFGTAGLEAGNGLNKQKVAELEKYFGGTVSVGNDLNLASKLAQTSFRLEVDKDGNTIVLANGQQIGYHIKNDKLSDGKDAFIVEKNMYGISSEALGNLFRFLQGEFKSGALTPSGKAVPRFAEGGMVGGSGYADTTHAMLTPGEFVVSRKGVNGNTIGLLRRLNEGGGSGGANIILNVNAIDENGVAQFLRDKLAPMMREMSGRQGTVFLNTRGVSSNI